MDKTGNINIRIDYETHKRLKVKAAKEGKSIKQLVAELVKRK